MENNKNIAFMLGFLIFVLLSLFCNGFTLTTKINASRNTVRRPSDVMCYFQKHLIRSNEEHCFQSRPKRQMPRQDFMDEFPLATQASLIAGYRNSPSVRSIPNLPRPFDEVLVKDIVNQQNKAISIPLVLKATIRYNDLPRSRNNARTPIPANVKTQVIDMNKIPYNPNTPDQPFDDDGHLLAFSLGGGMNNIWNYAPQINRLNRNTHEGGTSPWREEESNIARFLELNQQGFVDWRMVVIYDLSNARNIRPIGFCLLYSATDNRNIKMKQHEMCFSNDPASECFIDERDRCTGVPI